MKKVLSVLLALAIISLCGCAHNQKSEPFAVFNEDGKFGFINQSGKQVLDYQYDDARSFHDGLAAVQKDGKFGYIDANNKMVIDCQFAAGFDFNDGLACVMNEAGQYGFINTKGDVEIDYQFDSATAFAEKLAAVRGKNGLYGFINQIGEVKVDFKYTGAISFSDGLACVWNGDSDGNVRYSYIDYNGVPRINLDEHITNATSFNNGKALVQVDGVSWYFIDKSGKKGERINGNYDTVTPFKCGMATVKRNDKWGYINEDGKLVVDCKYDYAVSYINDLAFASTSGDSTIGAEVINKKGKVVYKYPDIKK